MPRRTLVDDVDDLVAGRRVVEPEPEPRERDAAGRLVRRDARERRWWEGDVDVPTDTDTE